MKTFLLDTLNKYKRISKGLDAKAILCNKSWQVFNNSGEKEIYIFQEDGSLIISLNGKAIVAKWTFIPANDNVLISHNQSSYMMKPFFNDDNLFVLQLDGTNEYSFLIDESQKSAFPLKTLKELESHLKGIYELEERKKIESKQIKIAQTEHEKKIKEAEAQRRIAQEAQEKRNKEVEAEKIRLEKEKNDIFQKKVKYVDQLWEEQKNNILSKDEYYSRYSWITAFNSTFLKTFVILTIAGVHAIFYAYTPEYIGTIFISQVITPLILGYYISYKIDKIEQNIYWIIDNRKKAFYLNHEIRIS